MSARSLLTLGLLVAVAAVAGRADARLRLEMPTFEVERVVPRLGQDLSFAGGGARGDDMTPVIAFLLGLFPGFGIGHLFAGDQEGFTFWLVVDLVVLAVFIVVSAVFLWRAAIFVNALVWIVWLALHVVQGFDAMESAGGSNPLRNMGKPARRKPNKASRRALPEEAPSAVAPSLLSFAF